jgi:hypothetical protein
MSSVLTKLVDLHVLFSIKQVDDILWVGRHAVEVKRMFESPRGLAPSGGHCTGELYRVQYRTRMEGAVNKSRWRFGLVCCSSILYLFEWCSTP